MSACFVTTDPPMIDKELVHRFLSQSYWAKGIPREVFEQAIAYMERWDPEIYRR